ncbi:MAG: hypothetical protein VB084_08485 [Syntrophomonadaceae bacterium]|nr:hypothetical protein [Syntrophomonadaceae bacterium]
MSYNKNRMYIVRLVPDRRCRIAIILTAGRLKGRFSAPGGAVSCWSSRAGGYSVRARYSATKYPISCMKAVPARACGFCCAAEAFVGRHELSRTRGLPEDIRGRCVSGRLQPDAGRKPLVLLKNGVFI